jgi:hypothetical protein
MLLILKKEQVEFARLRVLTQSLVNKEKGPEAYDEFRKMAFPWVETQKGRDRMAHIKILQEEVKKGVLGIAPLWENNQKIKSKMRTRVVASNDLKRSQKSTEDEKRIYSKMRSIVPR